jgi:hypothetical protein
MTSNYEAHTSSYLCTSIYTIMKYVCDLLYVYGRFVLPSREGVLGLRNLLNENITNCNPMPTWMNVYNRSNCATASNIEAHTA